MGLPNNGTPLTIFVLIESFSPLNWHVRNANTILLLRQDPEVCPDSQRVFGHDDGDGDDDDDDDDHQYAPHKQCI